MARFLVSIEFGIALYSEEPCANDIGGPECCLRYTYIHSLVIIFEKKAKTIPLRHRIEVLHKLT